jgi:hypothetical protein
MATKFIDPISKIVAAGRRTMYQLNKRGILTAVRTAKYTGDYNKRPVI